MSSSDAVCRLLTSRVSVVYYVLELSDPRYKIYLVTIVCLAASAKEYLKRKAYIPPDTKVKPTLPHTTPHLPVQGPAAGGCDRSVLELIFLLLKLEPSLVRKYEKQNDPRISLDPPPPSTLLSLTPTRCTSLHQPHTSRRLSIAIGLSQSMSGMGDSASQMVWSFS